MADYLQTKVDLTTKIGPAGSHWAEIDELREKHRFFRNESDQGSDYWVLTRYDDIREAFRDPSTFCNRSIVPTDPDPAYRFLPSFLDPPRHGKFRRLMNGWFAPAAVARWRPELERMAGDTIDAVVPDGRCDLLDTLGDEFPVKGFLLSMGLGLEDADFFVDCVHRMSGVNDVGHQEELMKAWGEVATYWQDLLAERRRQPADPEVDFVTHMLNARIDGEPVPDDEITDTCVTLTFGSLETLKSQLGWCFYHLATHPEDRRRLVDSPELIPSAVEEFLRAYPIVSMARKVTKDVNFHGCPMKQDDMVLLTIQSATRDPRQFPDPAHVQIDRNPNRHIAFGASEHRCVGSHLARAELQTAIAEWHKRIPDYSVEGDEPILAHGGQVSVLSLPLTWR